MNVWSWRNNKELYRKEWEKRERDKYNMEKWNRSTWRRVEIAEYLKVGFRWSQFIIPKNGRWIEGLKWTFTLCQAHSQSFSKFLPTLWNPRYFSEYSLADNTMTWYNTPSAIHTPTAGDIGSPLLSTFPIIYYHFVLRDRVHTQRPGPGSGVSQIDDPAAESRRLNAKVNAWIIK